METTRLRIRVQEKIERKHVDHSLGDVFLFKLRIKLLGLCSVLLSHLFPNLHSNVRPEQPPAFAMLGPRASFHLNLEGFTSFFNYALPPLAMWQDVVSSLSLTTFVSSSLVLVLVLSVP